MLQSRNIFVGPNFPLILDAGSDTDKTSYTSATLLSSKRILNNMTSTLILVLNLLILYSQEAHTYVKYVC